MKPTVHLRRCCGVGLLLAVTGLAPLAAHEGDHVDEAADTAAQRAGFATDVTTFATPWTHLAFDNDPRNFQFAIVTDRTGGPRAGVFEDAIRKLNWLRPEFVISVGDLIKGNGRNAAANEKQWDQFMAMLAPLHAPFFFAAGNHDIQMKEREDKVSPAEMLAAWQARFGPTYYSFVYQDVLFVVLFSNDGAERELGDAQLAWFEQLMRDQPRPRWTVVLLHHPLWIYPHESGFDRVAAALGDRPHTVFAGHQHRYVHFDRGDHDYFILGTTGGESPLRGDAFGEFDHVTWLTMTDDGPVVANLRLDGILPEDVSTPESVARVTTLESAARIESTVIVDDPAQIGEAGVILRLRNPTDRPFRFEGSFLHQHHVHPEPGELAVDLPPRTTTAVWVKLDVVSPFAAGDGEFLRFEGGLTVADGELDGPRLPLAIEIGLQPEAESAVWRTRAIEFVDTITLPRPNLPSEVTLHFTTDGSEPTAVSPVWAGEQTFTDDVTVRGRLFGGGRQQSAVGELQLSHVPAGSGLQCAYYEFDGPDRRPGLLPDFGGLVPQRILHVPDLDLRNLDGREEDFGAVFRGMIEVPETGNYGFHLISEDGARLRIDGATVVDDPIKHPRQEATGFATLTAGRHAIEVAYFQANHGATLALEMTLPSGTRQPVTRDQLSYNAHTASVSSQP